MLMGYFITTKTVDAFRLVKANEIMWYSLMRGLNVSGEGVTKAETSLEEDDGNWCFYCALGPVKCYRHG